MKTKQNAASKQLTRAIASLEALISHLDDKDLTIEADLVEAAAGHVQGAQEMLAL
jgi:hypothetical protein